MKKATISNVTTGQLACWGGLACAVCPGVGFVAAVSGLAILG